MVFGHSAIALRYGRVSATGMAQIFDQIAERVQLSIENNMPPAEHLGIGVPLDREWFVNELITLKASAVYPFSAEMRDDLGEGLVVLQVLVVADDGEGAVVVFHPQADEFVLANRDADPDATRSVGLVSCGIRGDVIDCFMSR